MSRSPLPMEAPHRWMLLFSGVILAVIAVVAGLWLAVGDGRKTGVSNPAESPAGPGRDVSKPRKADGGQKTGGGGSGSYETTPGTALIALSRGYERDG